jgi:Ni,Fe-hydrogenase maturation factor
MSLVNSLVIGYGNSLRGDDSIGIKVAQIVADWHLPKVRSLSPHQLTPELAAELAQVDLAIFTKVLILTL